MFDEFGRPSEEDLHAAIVDAYRREYKRMMKEQPMTPEAVREWHQKYDFLTEKLKLYGYGEPLPYELSFDAPTPGNTEQTEPQENGDTEQDRKGAFNRGQARLRSRVEELVRSRKNRWQRRFGRGPHQYE